MGIIMFALDGSNSIPDATKRTHRLEGLRITWMASLYLWAFIRRWRLSGGVADVARN